MDRRNLGQVGSAGGTIVQTGPVASRPSPALAGRVYIASPVFVGATTVGGTNFDAAQIDTGSQWLTPETIIFKNRNRVLNSTGGAGVQQNIFSGVLRGRVLGTGGRITIDVIGKIQSASSVTMTVRLKYGTATVISWPQVLANGFSPAGVRHRIALTPATGGGSQVGVIAVEANGGGGGNNQNITTTPVAVDSTVSQALTVSYAFSRASVGTKFTAYYVSASWSG